MWILLNYCFNSCTVIYVLLIRFLFTFYFCVGWWLHSILGIYSICRHIFLMHDFFLTIWQAWHIILIYFKKTIIRVVLLKCILILVCNFLKWFNCVWVTNIARLIFIWLLSSYVDETIAFNNTINWYLIEVLWLNTIITQKALTVL